MMRIASAVGAARLLPEHMFGVVRYASLLQQLPELLVERHFLVVFALIENVAGDLLELRSTYAERPIPVRFGRDDTFVWGESPHSVRNACSGSMREARRAGK